MTSPERLRARQRRELALVIVILVGSLIYGIYDGQRDQDRRDCIATSFAELRDYTDARDKLSERATALRNKAQDLQVESNDIQSDLIRDVFEAQVRTELTRAFVRFDRRDNAWELRKKRLDRKIARNLKQREEIKLPPFPSGKCDANIREDLK